MSFGEPPLGTRMPSLRRRDQLIRTIRRFFWDREYLEVETPLLAATPIPEAHLELFATTLLYPDYCTREPSPLFLLPSPEYYLKQLLAAGSGSLFEITHSFRNVESIGPQHNPEFTMLEWYALNASATDNIATTTALLRALGFAGECRVWTMDEAFARVTGTPLHDLLRVEALGEAARAAGMAVAPDEDWETLFQRYFLTVVETQLPTAGALFLTNYPAAIPTLARPVPNTPWADRWELYIDGVEVANCYGEETDPARIAAFFAAQAAQKTRHARIVHPVDHRYLQAPARLPECSGVAMGVDRLTAILSGAGAIDQVISFPISAIIAARNSHKEE